MRAGCDSVIGGVLRAASEKLAAVLFPIKRGSGISPLPRFSPARSDRLDEIRCLIRLGFSDEAETLIRSEGDDCVRHADCLNLLGVIEESRGSWKIARQWYGRAIRADRAHAPAQQNLRRIYELRTFGHSDQRITLGDERPALNELLNSRPRRDDSQHATPMPCEQMTRLTKGAS